MIRLAAGDRVPADARLIETRDLHLQEAALTGESLPVEKTAVDVPSSQVSVGEGRHTVFLGTSVVSGTALAVVVATGRATAFGDIAARLASAPPETEFQRGLRRFALLIMRTVLFLVLFVLAASLIMHRPPLESFLFAVALAVGLTPEFLPMITTVTLARGAVRMARRDVIVEAPQRHRGLRQHGRAVQRQDGHAHRGPDGARPAHRPIRPRQRARLRARLPERGQRDRDPQPAR